MYECQVCRRFKSNFFSVFLSNFCLSLRRFLIVFNHWNDKKNSVAFFRHQRRRRQQRRFSNKTVLAMVDFNGFPFCCFFYLANDSADVLKAARRLIITINMSFDYNNNSHNNKNNNNN